MARHWGGDRIANRLFLEQRYNPELQKTDEEYRKRKRQMTLGFTTVLVVGVIVFTLLFLFLE